MTNWSEEVERTEALLRDAMRIFAEPTTTYSKAAAAAVVVESLRLYRRALEGRRAALRSADAKTAHVPTYPWRGSLTGLSDAPASSTPAAVPLSPPSAERLN
jgi:hypothetical protein